VRLCGALGRRHSIADVPYPLMACAAHVAERLAAVRRKEPSLTTYGIGALAFDMTLDIGRARAELGYAPPVGVAAGFQRTAAWLRRHHG
jgi:nucleoside-diphosphate-sugar epimerase